MKVLKKRVMKRCVLLLFCLFTHSVFAETPSLSVVFEHNPPFQTLDAENQGHGPIIDFTKHLIAASNLNAEFSGKPWARIMEKDAYLPNTLILSMSRTPQREANFIWLTSVYTGQQYIWKVKGRVDPTDKPLQISVERNAHKMISITHHFGEENVLKSLNSAQALHALLRGRVDRFVGTVFAVSGKLQSLGYDMSQLERLDKFDDTGFASLGLSFALTHDSDKEIESALRNALDDPDVAMARAKLQQKFELAEQKLMQGFQQH